MNFLQDIKTAVKLTGEIRKARKAGATAVEIKPVRTVPVYTLAPGFYSTGEGCALSWHRETCQAVSAVYSTFDNNLRCELSKVPETGEWMDRIQFWKEKLAPVLPPKQYHDALIVIINWGIRCQRRRLEATV